MHNASPSPDRIRLGPKGPSVYMASRSKAPVTTEGVYPYVVRHTGYLREVWCVNTEKVASKARLGIESVLSGARMHTDSRAVIVPLKRRRG